MTLDARQFGVFLIAFDRVCLYSDLTILQTLERKKLMGGMKKRETGSMSLE